MVSYIPQSNFTSFNEYQFSKSFTPARPRVAKITIEMERDSVVEFVQDRRVTVSNIIGSIGEVEGFSARLFLVIHWDLA